MLRNKTFAPEFSSLISNWYDMREQAPGANLLHESVSGASSLVCTEICLPWNDVSPVGQSIGQFRIPGRTGASGVKPIKVRLMRGRNKSTRHCFAFNCTNKKQKKTFEKYLGLASVRFFFHSFRTTQISIVPWECRNESDVCDNGLQLWIICSLSPEQCKCYEAHRNMFSSFRRRSWTDWIGSCFLNFCITKISSAKTSEKSMCESSARKSSKNHTDVEEQGVYLQKTNKT